MKNISESGSRISAAGKLLAGLLLLCLILAGCAMYKGTLKTTQTLGTAEPSGTFTVIRYGANSFEDYLTFALIIPEGGSYTFDIYKPSFEYRSTKGLSWKQAFEMSKTFVSSHPEFEGSRIVGILGLDNKIIGYEVRPLYRTTLFGQQDIISIFYILKEHDVVEVRADLEREIKDKLRGGGNGRGGGHGK